MALTDNLVAYYKLDETSGNASDSSGSGFTLTNNNTVSYATGKINNGADFGSTNTNKSLTNTSNLGLSQNSDWAVSYWGKNAGTDSTGTFTFQMQWNGNRYMYIFRDGANNRWTMDNGGGLFTQTVQSISNSTWYHVLVQRSGSTVSVYINNVFLASTTAYTGTSGALTNGVKIGYSDYTGVYQVGMTDEVAIYSRALSADERTQIYRYGSANQYPFTSSLLSGGLISYYNFNSSNSNDSIGGNNGTDTAITYSTGNGKLGIGAGFNGSTSKIDFGTPSNLAFEYTQPFTISCWYNPTSTSSSCMIFSKELVGGNYTGYGIYMAAGVPTLILVGNLSNQTYVNGTTNLTGGTWYHLVFTWAGVGNGTGSKVYVNGKDNTASYSPSNLSTSILNAATVQIGNRGTGDLPLNGKVDELGVWNRQLSVDEVQQLFNNGKANAYPLDTPSLYGNSSYYKFNETTGNAVDSTINALTLTNTSTTYSVGKIGNGASFNGSSSRLVSATTTLPAAFTFAFWFKRNSLKLEYVLSNYLASDDAANKNFSIIAYIDGANQKLQAGTHVAWLVANTTNFASGTWYHIVVTHTGSNVTFYVNGVADGTAAQTHAESTGKAITYGIRGDLDPNYYLDGMLDEIGLWNRALSSTEVTALYNTATGLQYNYITTAPIIDSITAVTNSNTVSSKTFSHTCSTDSNRVLTVQVGCGSAQTVTGVTYGGVAMTRINQVNLQSTWSELWYLVAPATGANNVVITCSGSTNITGGAISFTNAAQSGVPDSQTADTSQTGSVTSYSISTTPTSENTVLVFAGRANGGLAVTGTGNTFVSSQPEVGAYGMFSLTSLNTQNNVGVSSLSVTSSAQQYFGVVASIKGYSIQTTPNGAAFLFLMM